MRFALALAAAAQFTVPVPPAHAQEFGRLFHTPEQREALDARRSARLPEKPIAPAPARSTRVDGYVLRSGGRSTVWLNGEATIEGADPQGIRVRVRRDAPGRVSLAVDENAQTVQMKIGATLDHGSGAARDLIGEGEIRISR